MIARDADPSDRATAPDSATAQDRATAPDDATASVGIRELRSDLARIIARAGVGQRTVVTQHGIAVAEVGPLGRESASLESLIATGAVVPPRRNGQWRAPDGVAIAAGTRIDQAMRDIRG